MQTVGLWPLGVYFILVVILLAVMLFLSYVLGERHKEQATDEPYESGVPIIGTARQIRRVHPWPGGHVFCNL